MSAHTRTCQLFMAAWQNAWWLAAWHNSMAACQLLHTGKPPLACNDSRSMMGSELSAPAKRPSGAAAAEHTRRQRWLYSSSRRTMKRRAWSRTWQEGGGRGAAADCCQNAKPGLADATAESERGSKPLHSLSTSGKHTRSSYLHVHGRHARNEHSVEGLGDGQVVGSPQRPGAQLRKLEPGDAAAGALLRGSTCGAEKPRCGAQAGLKLPAELTIALKQSPCRRQHSAAGGSPRARCARKARAAPPSRPSRRPGPRWRSATAAPSPHQL